MVDFEHLEDPQRRTVLAYDRNYAVTAGAGSGKTTTFAMRYLTLLERTDADPGSMAAITFTESGATELQERVREAVSDRLAESDGDRYEVWREHHDALPEAYVHTIHGFCSRLLREYALEADVPVGFDVIEETAARGQQLDTVERFVEHHLDDDRIERLTGIYYRDRLEELLADLLDEHHHARAWAERWADASPDDYLAFVRERYAPVDIEAARGYLEREDVRTALQDVYRVAAEESSGGDRITIAANVASVVEVHGSDPGDLDDAGVHDAVAAICQGLTSDGTAYRGGFDTWPYTGYDDWSDTNSRRFEEATTTLTTVLPVEEWATPDRLGVDRNAAGHYVVLASLYRDLHDAYQERKRRETALDFGDLVDAAIELLRTSPEVRDALRESFDYVMLDEVQDTDPRQWELVELLTSITGDYDECNVFVVGDEKQSIFRFRGADVAQFGRERHRLEAANDGDDLPPLEEIHPADGDGGLDRNFRSLPGVLEPVNDLFDELFGVIPETYREAPRGIPDDDTSHEPEPQRLTPDRVDDAGLGSGATFVVVPEEAEARRAALPEGHDLRSVPDDSTELDARALAAEVSSFLDGDPRRYETVGFEDGEPVEEPTDLDPSDVAILLRKRTHLKEYERALAALDVPYTVASGIGFYGSTEVVALRNLFRVLADPTDDLALFSVLRSPLFGFEDAPVLALWGDVDRDRVGKGELWNALETADDDRLVAAREHVEDWRRAAGVGDGDAVVETWDALLGRIVDDTGYLASLATDERGRQAVANVEKFRARLREWSEEGLRTLPAVVDRIEREVELSSREGEAEVPEDADGVRIMTVHDAKGREFPAVFVPGLSKNFNTDPRYGEGVAEFETVDTDGGDAGNPLLGIRGPGVTDRFVQNDTILKRRLKFARTREVVAEEKRILYVATTRARDHLYLVGTTSADDGAIEALDEGDAEDPTCWYDLVAPVVLDEETREALARDGRAMANERAEYPLTVRFPREETRLARASPSDPPSLSFDVGNRDPEREYSIAASYLGSLVHEGAPGEVAVDHSGQYVSYSPPEEKEDSDDGSGESGTAEYLPRSVFGDALHRAMKLDVDPGDVETIRRLAVQFASEKDVSTDRIDESDVAELQGHLRVAREYLDGVASKATQEERPVRASLENGEVYGDIDHLAVTEDSYHVVDYKTNRLSDPGAMDEKAAHYVWQMKAYAVALHQSDPTRDVKATLLFTGPDELREFEWTPAELEEMESRLDGAVYSALDGTL